MKRIVVCAMCALAGIALALVAKVGSLTGALGLFTRIGGGMRALSLSGEAGNIAAWAIYAVLCALPLVGLLPVRRKRGWADILFLLASAYSVWLWLMLANPTRLMPLYYPGSEEVYGLMSGSVLLSFVVGGLLFRLAEDVRSEVLLGRTSGALMGIAALVSLTEGVACAALVMGAQGGVEVGYALWLCLCSIASSAVSVWTLFGAADLVSGMRAGWFVPENAKRADELSKRAKWLLVVTVAGSLLANLAALVMTGSVSSANVRFYPPVTELIEAMCCMLLARFIGEGARIKAENDEFV